MPDSERRALRTRATASRSSNGPRTAAAASARGERAVYFPIAYVASSAAGAPPLGYDLGSGPARGAVPARARDTRQRRRQPGDPAADRRHRHQRLPAGLPRRRADRDRGAAARGADRLRRRQLPHRRPRRRGDRRRRRRRRSAAAGRTARRRRARGRARRRRPAPAPDRRPHLAAGRPDPGGPDVSLPAAAGVVGHLAGGPARRADPHLEPRANGCRSWSARQARTR